MGFLVYALITLVTTVASYFIQRALAPHTKDPRGQDFQGPTATAGNPIPVWWGTAEVAPNTVWWGLVQKQKNHQWFYSMTAHHLLGWGVVNEIIDISFADKSCRNHLIDGHAERVIGYPENLLNSGMPGNLIIFGNSGARTPDSPNPMFGGDEQGGGVGADIDSVSRGTLRMYWGFDVDTAQPLDDVLSSGDVYDADCSRFPNMAYVRMGELGTSFYIATQDGAPKPMKMLLRRTAWWDKMNAGTLSPLGQTAIEATIRTDANPAEILYDLLTHKGYGLGRSPDSIDLDSFIACATTLREEVITSEKTGFGISVLLTSPVDGENVIKNILETIDATLCTNPITGQLRLKLIRPDYEIGDLMQITRSNSTGMQFAPSTWQQTVNEIRLTYKRLINNENKRGFVDDVMTDQDSGNYQATGRIRSSTIDMPYITDPDTASLVCARIRRVHSVPLARASWDMNREGFGLMKGDAVVVQNSYFGMTDMVMRVTTIDYGTLEDGKLHIEAVQDVFSVTTPTYTTPNTGWTESEHTSDDQSGTGSVPDNAAPTDWGVGF